MRLAIALLMLAMASSPASSLTLAASSSSPARSRIPSSSSTAISATSTEAGSTASTCVPPPNSRIAQLLRHQQSQSLPGTKHKQSGRRSGQNLRYANYPESVDGTTTTTLVAPLFYHATGDEEPTPDFQPSPLQNDDRQRHVQIQKRRRRRARMLRPFSPRLSFRRKQKAAFASQDEEKKARLSEYEQRKAAWAAKYTSVSSLRTTFGTNKNKIFGDFDPFTTRRLYHTLLPRALLELRGLRDMMLDSTIQLSSKGGERGTTNNNNKDDLIIKQELKELAPLAYQARVAAKKYARERSRLPGRIGSMLYDGYRQWRRYGKWDNSGMSWDQVWAKYEDQVLGEVMEEMMISSSSSSSQEADMAVVDDGNDAELASTAATLFNNNYGNDFDDEELTARICLRILERSVATNEMVDKLFRRTEYDDVNDSTSPEESTPSKRRRRRERQQRHKTRILKDLQAIEQKFDDDIQELLRYSKLTTEEGDERRRKRQKGAFFWKKPITNDSPSAVAATKSTRGGGMDSGGSSGESLESKDIAAASFSVSDATTPPLRKLARHEIIALRILATTKQRIASLQATKED